MTVLLVALYRMMRRQIRDLERYVEYWHKDSERWFQRAIGTEPPKPEKAK